MTDEVPDFPDFGGMDSFAEIGKMGLSIYRAILRDGGNAEEAFSVTAAFFAGMMKGTTPTDDENTRDR